MNKLGEQLANYNILLKCDMNFRCYINNKKQKWFLCLVLVWLVIHQKRAGGSPCLQAWGGSSRPIDTKTTQYVDLQFIDFRYKICYNFSSEKR